MHCTSADSERISAALAEHINAILRESDSVEIYYNDGCTLLPGETSQGDVETLGFDDPSMQEKIETLARKLQSEEKTVRLLPAATNYGSAWVNLTQNKHTMPLTEDGQEWVDVLRKPATLIQKNGELTAIFFNAQENFTGEILAILTHKEMWEQHPEFFQEAKDHEDNLAKAQKTSFIEGGPLFQAAFVITFKRVT